MHRGSPGFIALRAGSTLLEVAPEIGGAISRFCTDGDAGRVQWFRPLVKGMPESPAAKNTGCFPLVPYANILRNAQILRAGSAIPVRRDGAGGTHSWHGDGWRHPWSVLECSANALEIELVNEGQWHPLRYRATQAFRLGQQEFVHEITLVNIGEFAFPAGVGLHPYFVVDATTRLRANLPEVWLIDADFLPQRRVSTPAEWSFSSSRALKGMNLKNCFCGWDGRATIEWNEGERILDIRATPGLRFLTIWTPAAGGFCCIEPMSHSADAFNLGHDGMLDVGYRLLGPNEVMRERVTYSWTFHRRNSSLHGATGRGGSVSG